MSKQARRETRKNKREQLAPSAKDRFNQILQEEAEDKVFEHVQQLPTLKPKTDNQKIALGYLNEGRPVVFLTGSAGTGKSLLATFRAACLLKQKKIDKVYLVRPAVSVGKSVGMLPGDVKEKLTPYFKQTLAHLEGFLGHDFMSYCTRKEIIEMLPVEYLRGMSFENSFVIAEEVQNFTSEEMEMMLTRLGQGCSIVFTGDTRQHDLKGTSGLELTLKLLDRVQATQPAYLDGNDIEALDSGIGIVRFQPEDVVRSGLTKAFVKIYYNN